MSSSRPSLRCLLLVACVSSALACGDDGGDDGGGPGDMLGVTIVSPTDGFARDETVNVQVTTTGGPGEVVLFIDDVERGAFDASNGYPWTTSSFADGPHVLVAEARRGGETARSAPVTITVDKVAPRLTDRAPAAGGQSFELSGDIIAEFSEPVRAADPRAAVDVVWAPQVCPTPPCTESPLDVDVTFDEDGEALVARLTTFPQAGVLPVDLRVRVGNGVTDLAGNPLVTSDMMGSWAFGAPAWVDFGARIILGASLTEAGDGATLTVGPDGKPYILWVGTNPATGIEDARLFGYESFWALEGNANEGTNIDVRASDLVVDAEGGVYAAVGGVSVASGDLVAVRRWDGTRFRELQGSPLLDEEAEGTQVVNLELEIAPSELAELAMMVETLTPLDGGGLERRVRVWRYIGTDWIQIGGDVPGSGEGARLAVDSRDRALVATLQPGIGDDSDVILHRFEGGEWRAVGPLLVHGGGGFALLIDRMDRPYLAVRQGVMAFPYVLDGDEWARLPGPGIEGASPEMGITADDTVVLGTTVEAAQWEWDGEAFFYDSYGDVAVEAPPVASRGLTLGLSQSGTVLRGASDMVREIRMSRFNAPVSPPED